MEKEFLHCLRAQIYPDMYYQERIDSIKNFCLDYGFQNVLLIFNGEEHNVGHIKDEELSLWIDVMKKAKEQFNEVGISPYPLILGWNWVISTEEESFKKGNISKQW